MVCTQSLCIQYAPYDKHDLYTISVYKHNTTSIHSICKQDFKNVVILTPKPKPQAKLTIYMR